MAMFLVAGGLVATGSAEAADFIRSDNEQGRVVINRSKTHHNLYTAGADVSVSSPTTGDLYVAGGWVSIDGPVEQDVVVAGGTVIISEPVNGDVRVAGGKVTINATVKGDVLAAAGDIVLTDKSSVGGELRVGGGTVIVDGPVAGGLYAMADKITVNSKIDGLVKVTANNELVFGPKAEVASEVSYIGKQVANVDSAAKVNVSFTALAEHERDNGKRTGFIGFLLGGFIIQFVAAILAGLLALRLFRGQLHSLTESMYLKPWGNLLTGFITAIVMPVTLIICLVLIVGYYIAIIAGMVYILGLLIAGLVSIFFLGAWLVKVLTKKTHLVLDWQALVIGTVLMIVLKWIPVVGWLAGTVLFLMAFGAMTNSFRAYLKRSSTTSATTVE